MAEGLLGKKKCCCGPVNPCPTYDEFIVISNEPVQGPFGAQLKPMIDIRGTTTTLNATHGQQGDNVNVHAQPTASDGVVRFHRYFIGDRPFRMTLNTSQVLVNTTESSAVSGSFDWYERDAVFDCPVRDLSNFSAGSSVRPGDSLFAQSRNGAFGVPQDADSDADTTGSGGGFGGGGGTVYPVATFSGTTELTPVVYESAGKGTPVNVTCSTSAEGEGTSTRGVSLNVSTSQSSANAFVFNNLGGLILASVVTAFGGSVVLEVD